MTPEFFVATALSPALKLLPDALASADDIARKALVDAIARR
jgi:hypothetical protein